MRFFPRLRRRIAALRFLLLGLAALVWFLARVVPKPSRAAYPCQRAAAPVAAGFVAWILGPALASRLWREGRSRLGHARRVAAIPLLAAALLVAAATALVTTADRAAVADPPLPNRPIGEAKGIHPGRVVWVHDPGATDWLGPGDGHWWEPEHTIQPVVDIMLSRALRDLTGEPTNAAAWDALFRASNVARGKGNVGYAPGEKIAIKVNLVGCHYLYGGVDPVTYDLTSLFDYMNTSPQTMLALVRGLVNDAGVPPEEIAIGDPTARFPNEYHDPIADEFPGLVFLDHDGGTPDHPRTAVGFSTVPLFWSVHPEDVAADFVPLAIAEAEYFVNLGSFKSHKTAGVTLCAKNLYGALIRIPTAAGYYNLHDHLPARLPPAGSYRPIVDLMGHADFGGKTLVYLIDALYSGVHNDDDAPRRWDFAPFSGDWTSSLFASQDPVALESVAFDFMQHEGDPHEYPQMPGADDYLTEAALAADPPSGTFYDPNHDGDVERLASLGVHEHWSDPVSMAYSRNLGSGEGIELVKVSSPSTSVGGAGRERPARVVGSPNPFRESVTLFFSGSERGGRSATVYDVRGRSIRPLEAEGGGNGAVVWNGRDDRGREAPPGVYFVRFESGGPAGRVVKVR